MAERKRDASGVPLPLRELIEVLAELSQTPPFPADGNWDRFRDVDVTRRSHVRWTLEAVSNALRSNDTLAAPVAAEALAMDCQRWAKAARKQLAGPLGYEPERAEGAVTDGSEGEGHG